MTGAASGPELDVFLPKSRPWNQELPSGLRARGLYLAQSRSEIEVVYATADTRPKIADLRSAWDRRWNKRSSAVLLVAGYPSPEGPRAALVGLRGEGTEVNTLPLDDVRRAVAKALASNQPSQA